MMFSQSSQLAPLALLISLATIIYGKELIDAPPVIIAPANLDKPENLVKIGKISEQVNSLTCTASNAETVEWVYLDEANSQTYKVVSSNVWTVLPPDTDGDTGDVSRTITDQGMTNNAERSDQTGYYKCIAKTSVNGNDYVTTTPPIRFISPAVTMRGSYVPVRDSSVPQYSPHSLKCIADMEIKPNDLFDFNVIKFVWFRYGEQLQVIEEDTRVTINPKTGDLYFAYIELEDQTGTDDGNDEYQCRIFVGDQVQETIASRYKLAVIANVGDEPPYQLVYPKEYKDRKVSCIEGTDCTVTCIYAGRELGSDPPNPNFVPPSSTFITDYKGNNAEFQAIDDAEGKWQCNIDSDPQKTAEIDVEIRNYPSVPADNMADQFVEVGTDVEFECNADHINIRDLFFYYNGNLIQAPATAGGIGNPPHVNYKAGSTAIKIPNAQRNHSSMVSCMAINSAGTKFKAAQLNIYDKPNITLSPATGYEITTDRTNTSIDYKFECMVEMDPKVTDATIHWRTNHTDVELSGQKITGEHDLGVKSVYTSKYNTITYQIRSTLTFLVDLDTESTIFGGHWECVVEFEIPGSAGDLISSSEPVPFTSAIANKGKVIAAAGFKDWWIIGVVVAIFFLLLLVILIVCCVKHHKGEQYYVDEKERMAGHNPEEEMGLYGFSDYKRPATGGYVPMYMSDQDPIKGSRTSMDMSDKPMESEGGSMDEYGDIDPGRFNEDGSFIGIYGKSSTNMDV